MVLAQPAGDFGVSGRWFRHAQQVVQAGPSGGSDDSSRCFRLARQVPWASPSLDFGTFERWVQHSKQVIQDRKSTRLNSSHANISYAVFCLKKKITTAIAIPG